MDITNIEKICNSAAKMSVGNYNLLRSGGCAFYNYYLLLLFHFHYTCRKYGLNGP